MKAFHVVLGIAGLSIVIAIGVSIKERLNYSNNEKAIRTLIADYKAIGVPTTGAEFTGKPTESGNAWPEVKSLLIASKNKSISQTSIALDLVRNCSRDDLPLMRRYLSVYGKERQEIERAINAKPTLKVISDPDQGLMKLYPELGPWRGISREMLLQAYVYGLEGNAKAYQAEIAAIMKLTESLAETAEILPILVTSNIRKLVIDINLRLLEEAPSMRSAIHQVSQKLQAAPTTNYKRFFQGDFLFQIATIRMLDHPAWDKEKPKFPLSLIVNGEDDGAKNFEGIARHDDYVPQSVKLRALLRSRLEKWKPFLLTIQNSNDPNFLPPLEDYQKVIKQEGLSEKLQSTFEFLTQISNDEGEEGYSQIQFPAYYKSLDQIAWKILDIKQATGAFPTSLKGISESEFDYQVKSNGFVLKVKTRIGDPDRIPKITYPLSLLNTDSGQRSRNERIEKFRKTNQVFVNP